MKSVWLDISCPPEVGVGDGGAGEHDRSQTRPFGFGRLGLKSNQGAGRLMVGLRDRVETLGAKFLDECAHDFSVSKSHVRRGRRRGSARPSSGTDSPDAVRLVHFAKVALA